MEKKKIVYLSTAIYIYLICNKREERYALLLFVERFEASFERKEKRITLNGGSLGSWVDEERS